MNLAQNIIEFKKPECKNLLIKLDPEYGVITFNTFRKLHNKHLRKCLLRTTLFRNDVV